MDQAGVEGATIAEPKQQPSVGRIVLVTPQPAHAGANGAAEYMAFVGQVGDAGECHLLVFPPMGGFYWEQAVPEYSGEGDKTRTWRWPPRV